MTIGAGSTLDVAGDLTLTSAATLDEQIGGTPASGLFGQTDIGGSAVLAGTLNLDLLDDYTPTGSDSFQVFTYTQLTARL